MPKWSFTLSVLVLLPALFFYGFVAWFLHYSLPEPNTSLFDPTTHAPILSESAILEYTRQLSEDIGYRTVGTRQHALADAWMLEEANKLKARCGEKTRSNPKRKLECEVWRQEGSGSHRFDMMGKRVFKTYRNLTNIIMRISDGSEEGKHHAVLVNAHLDSTLPSPGAADDALSVGVMIETARVLIDTDDWEPHNAVIFLWNNAEESLQDGSHLYSTQHETAPTVKAFVNLEAAGTTGPTLLFQATSEAMIEAYSKVPRPYGTVVANDIFSSGFILSDTDFRQFEQYLNVPGLDMAIVGHSYFYHTRKDVVTNIQPGVAQHMADQAHALISYFTSVNSSLDTIPARDPSHRPSTIFSSFFHRIFLQYSMSTATSLTLILLTSSTVLSFLALPTVTVPNLLTAFSAIAMALAGSLIGVNLVALWMGTILGKRLSWFSGEALPLFLYGPPTIAGALLTQLIPPFSALDEANLLAGTLLYQLLVSTTFITLARLGSSQILFFTGLSQAAALVYIYFMKTARHVPFFAYLIWQVAPVLIGTEVSFAVFDFFVPLSGRIGEEAPAEHIIASLVSIAGAITLPATLPFFARFHKDITRRMIQILLALTAIMVAVFSWKEPFDFNHPKRVFVIHSENVTSGEHSLHMAAADAAPGFDGLVQNIAERIHGDGLLNSTLLPITTSPMHEHNGDWDVLYPFSAFLTPYKIPLMLKAEYKSPFAAQSSNPFRIDVVSEQKDPVKRSRRMELEVHHPGLIWPVLAFDAQILSWSIDDNPPRRFSRHYIREGSFYGIHSYSLSLEIQLPEDHSVESPLRINFIGVREDAMYPGKRDDAMGLSVDGFLNHPMDLLERLDGYLEIATNGAADSLLMGCVAGVVHV